MYEINHVRRRILYSMSLMKLIMLWTIHTSYLSIQWLKKNISCYVTLYVCVVSITTVCSIAALFFWQRSSMCTYNSRYASSMVCFCFLIVSVLFDLGFFFTFINSALWWFLKKCRKGKDALDCESIVLASKLNVTPLFHL